MNQPKKKNSSKVNLTISFVCHSLLVGGLFYLAAREGILGKKMQTLAVTMVPKEKKPEPPKEKAPEPKLDTPKVAEAARPVSAPAAKVETAVAPPPSSEAPTAVAPAAVITSDMEGFTEGAHDVADGDPSTVYKNMVERVLKTHWNRPEDIADETFVAEAELTVDNNGKVGPYRWIRGSGNRVWDDSVKTVLGATKSVNRAPPKGFPGKFTVRFDVETSKTEELNQISAR
jgi:TonB C terminal